MARKHPSASPVLAPNALSARIDAFPRVGLAHLPTPLEFCPRLTEALGGPKI